jgi:hypothetical protein
MLLCPKWPALLEENRKSLDSKDVEYRASPEKGGHANKPAEPETIGFFVVK